MIRSTDIAVADAVIPVNPEPAQTNQHHFTTLAFLFQSVAYMFNVAAIRRPIAARVGHLWTNYYPPRATEEAVVMPPSTLGFIIATLLSFVDIKSQGNPEFPFQTHPHAIMISITSLVMYGLISGAELVASHPTSVYAIIARVGRIGSLCVLIVSLLSLFYV